MFLAGAAQGDALVQQAARADFGSFADHHTHAVVDKNAMADAGTGVDLDAGEGTTHLAQAAGGQF